MTGSAATGPTKLAVTPGSSNAALFRASWEEEIATQTAGLAQASGRTTLSNVSHSTDSLERSGDMPAAEVADDPRGTGPAVSGLGAAGQRPAGSGMEMVSTPEATALNPVVDAPIATGQHFGEASTSWLRGETQSASIAHAKTADRLLQQNQTISLPAPEIAFPRADFSRDLEQSSSIAVPEKGQSGSPSETRSAVGQAVEQASAERETAPVARDVLSIRGIASTIFEISASASASTALSVPAKAAARSEGNPTVLNTDMTDKIDGRSYSSQRTKKSEKSIGAPAGDAGAQIMADRVSLEHASIIAQEAASNVTVQNVVGHNDVAHSIVHSASAPSLSGDSSTSGLILLPAARSVSSSRAGNSPIFTDSVPQANRALALASALQSSWVSRNSRTQTSSDSQQQSSAARLSAASSSLDGESVLQQQIATRADSSAKTVPISVREFAPDPPAGETQTMAAIDGGPALAKAASLEKLGPSGKPVDSPESPASVKGSAKGSASPSSSGSNGAQLNQQLPVVASVAKSGSDSHLPAELPGAVHSLTATTETHTADGSGETTASVELRRGGQNIPSAASAPSAGGVPGHALDAALANPGLASQAAVPPGGIFSFREAFRSNSSNISQNLEDVSRNPFPAMDGVAKVPTSPARTSTTGELQVGYQDPVLGYVELRARGDGIGVHASLGVQSESAGETLEGHLSSLAGWMNERHTPVESLTVLTANVYRDATPETNPDSRSFHTGAESRGHGMESGSNAGQDAGRQDAREDGSSGRGMTPVESSERDPIAGYGSAAGPPQPSTGAAGSVFPFTMPGGSSISVMA
jgi:hypothetical protein